MDKTVKYLVFGEIIWDVYPDKRVIGGAPFNFSANVSLMGGDVYFVTGLGQDELGKDAEEYIGNYGIKTDFLCRNDKPTGQCLVTLNEKGVPQYNVLTDVAYDNVTVSDEMLAAMKAAQPQVFYFNTLAQRCEVSAAAIRTILDSMKFECVFCDVNIRPGCWDRNSLNLCMERADIVKISDEEAHFLTECGLVDAGLPFGEAVQKAYPNLKLLIFTMGSKGSAVYDFANGTVYESGEPGKVKVVSTVGAGDCYSASFVHSYLTGASIPEAIRIAAHRSDIVVSHTEAIPDALKA